MLKSSECRAKKQVSPPSLYGNGRPSSALNALKREREPAGSRTTDRNLNRRESISSRQTKPSNSWVDWYV